MLGASFLPARFRNDHSPGTTSNPGYLNQKITPLLQSISRRAFHHPIRTIVFVALLASTSYVGLLEGSLFDGTTLVGDVLGGTDLKALVEGGRRLRLGPETSWNWQIGSEEFNDTAAQHLVLATLVFPNTKSDIFQRTVPVLNHIPMGKTKSVRALSSTSDASAPISQDTHLAFSIPFDEASNFLNLVQELPTAEDFSTDLSDEGQRTTAWVMKVAKPGQGHRQISLRWWASNAWTSFVDLLKVGPRSFGQNLSAHNGLAARRST
jgi:hydroxymethylglutaryl-CoA reductase (NADPH)